MSRSVAVVDYGMGNLRSVSQAVLHVAREVSKLGTDIAVHVTADPAVVRAAERVVLPGQGAMRDCMHELGSAGPSTCATPKWPPVRCTTATSRPPCCKPRRANR